MHLQPLGNNSLTMISNEVTLSKANHKTFPNNQIWLADRKQAPRTHVYRSEKQSRWTWEMSIASMWPSYLSSGQVPADTDTCVYFSILRMSVQDICIWVEYLIVWEHVMCARPTHVCHPFFVDVKLPRYQMLRRSPWRPCTKNNARNLVVLTFRRIC